jgi:DNA-binding transcriptional LysR family regulator
MELHQIRHFIAVAEAGGFTKGAERAAVSQPAISASIAKLEAELHVKLLDRRHSPIVPTAAGARLLEAGKSVLQTCNAVKLELNDLAAPKLLRIGVLQSLSNFQVSNLLGSFRRAHSHIAMEVSDGSSEQLMELLAEWKLDAVVTTLDQGTSKFASRILFKQPYVLAVPLDHRFACRKCVRLAELEDEPFIVRTGCDTFQDASNALVSRGFRIRVVYKTAHIDRTLALVAAGIGISFVPAWLARPGVKRVQVPDLGFFRAVGLLWPPEREDGYLKQFITFAERHCARHSRVDNRRRRNASLGTAVAARG